MDLDNPSYFSVAPEDQDCYNDAAETSLCRQLTPPRHANRREFKSFLRSVSTNSADSNQELLIMGEPRLSDMDPDLAFKHPTRSNSLKRGQENGHADLMYFPLPTSEEAADELDNDEVFIGEDSARYCNFAAARRVPNGSGSPRRHSLGTFSARDRTNSVASSSKSFKDDFPQMVQESDVPGVSAIDEHSLRHRSFPRKRCIKCTKGTLTRPNANMDDILIVSLNCSDAATLWVEYFTNYFQQISKQANRKPFKIQNMSVEDVLTTKTQEKDFSDKATGVKLQLVVVCPSFLEFVAEHPEETSSLGKVLLPDRTLALLLGVADNDLNETHKTALPTYFQWQRQTVGQDQDENFTKEFLSQAMAIFSKIWKQQSSVISQEKTCFSVSPKKIRQGQNGVFILLTYPLQKDDIVKISIERNGVIQDVKSVKRRNPHIIKIIVPENLTEVTAIVNVLVEKNGSIIGSRPIKCESKLRELEQLLRSANNPVDFMCKALGFTPADKEHLDNWLVHGFQKSLPPHFSLLGNHNTPFAATIQVHKHSNEEFPTLLHFAAKFGLEKLALQLIDCPGADVAYEIRNVFDLTPFDMAEAAGYHQLASMLRSYMNMNEVTNVYSKLKEISLQQKSSEEDDEGYMAPTNVVQEFYKICPAPRPVVPEQKSPLTTPSSEYGSNLYMAMSTPVISKSREELNKKPETPKIKKDNHEKKHQKKIDVVEDKVQKELAEIINDFKNNVHSLPQVEKLVQDWKNRNDVQKSFKEKQEQLMEMRLRYEQIQQEMKAAMKKSTPFERIKRLFSKPKHNGTEDKSEELTTISVISSPAVVLNQGSRPISSLSTSSSGSSGRMSTISGSSLGDSGTHSDNEERKMMLGSSHSESDFKSELDKAILKLNYTPVPIPKPVNKFQNMHHFETIEEKPLPRPNNLSLDDQLYIQFPPNGQPVVGIPTEARNSTEYMNIPVENHEYMNFKPSSFS